MDALEVQRELVKFLLKRLKDCALESMSFHAVFHNMTDEAKALAEATREFYRKSDAFRQKLESQFHGLDELIEKVDAGIQETEFRRLLEQFDPTGKPN